MQNGVDRPIEEEWLGHVVRDDLEAPPPLEVLEVAGNPGNQVVDADDVVTVGQQTLAQVRSEEARPTRDDRSGCHPLEYKGRLRAADAAIDEAAIAHGLGVEDVAAVNDHRTAHQALQAIEVALAELVPR